MAVKTSEKKVYKGYAIKDCLFKTIRPDVPIFRFKNELLKWQINNGYDCKRCKVIRVSIKEIK